MFKTLERKMHEVKQKKLQVQAKYEQYVDKRDQMELYKKKSKRKGKH